MKNKESLRWSGFIVLLLAICLLTFRGATAQEKKEILIGAPVSISGPSTMQGLEMRWAYEQALADFMKAKGGILVKEIGKKVPIKLILRDDESDADKAAAVMERLIRAENVDFFLSTQVDHKVYACAVIAEKYKKYHHASVCSRDIYLQGRFNWSTDIFVDHKELSSVAFEIFKTQLTEAERPKRIGLFYMDNPPGEVFSKRANENRVQYGYPPFAVDEPFPFGAKDYSSLVMKAKAAKIDALLLLALTEDTITLVRQMKENDLSVPYFHGWAGTNASQFYDALGKDADYVVMDGLWSKLYPYRGSMELGERFKKEFKKDSVYIGMFYTQAKILFEAIEKAGTLDGAKVREVVMKTTWKNTLLGDLKYDEHGFALIPSCALQWWKGEQKLTYPFLKGGWQVKLAPPWDKR